MTERDKDKQRGIREMIDALDDSTDNIRIGNLFSLNPTFPLMKELYFLRNKLSKNSLNLAFKRFPARIKKGANGQFIQHFLQTVPITIGMEAPDVSTRNAKGELINLKGFKGKVVLLDFWASWCGPCRQNNKQMIKLYGKFRKKGFEIVSFNLDTRKQLWLNASRKDSIQ